MLTKCGSTPQLAMQGKMSNTWFVTTYLWKSKFYVGWNVAVRRLILDHHDSSLTQTRQKCCPTKQPAAFCCRYLRECCPTKL